MRQAFDGHVVQRSRRQVPLWITGGALVLAAGAIVLGAVPDHPGLPVVAVARAKASPASSTSAKPAEMSGPAANQAHGPAGASLWVSRPVHVAGPSPSTVVMPTPTQAVPANDTYPLALIVPERVRLIDGSAFQLGEARYRLTSLDTVGVVQGCEASRGGRCISHPRHALRVAIAGRTLHCRLADGDGRRETLVTCHRDGTDAVAALP